ncbi:pyruvate kinase [Candidatus Peregrinibacteria bacterium]|jgi:pyruvate kinase|nr:pyruvate kinase [Candidatus Peregrinibacteria bacterium]MBT7703302.1 pyruvate kinase [Candidatus Peregrinibacteria bacterium]
MTLKKNTKIVCTLGPASDNRDIIEKMLNAGMNVARLNFSHGSYEHMEKICRNLRTASKRTKHKVAIMQDLQGPKIRVGQLPEEGIILKRAQKITLVTGRKTYKNNQIPVPYKDLHKDVKKGDCLLLDDGYLEVEVTHKLGHEINCRVKTGGVLKSNKGINCPTATIRAKAITTKDLKDLEFGLTQDIDYVSLSFVKSAQDIQALRAELVKRGHPEVQIIAKIERHEAIKNLDGIMKEADGIMVARGDLGLEIPAEKVPIAQKEIVRLGLIHGKPVIIATQILESMISNPRATRAEVSDAATAIFDHADAFMLSGETSVGKYPIRAVSTLAKVAHAVEKELRKKEHLINLPHKDENVYVSDAISLSAALLAEDIKAKAIVVITKTGYTARQIMKHRPTIPVVAITYDPKIECQLKLVWGINKVHISKKHITTDIMADEMVPKILSKLEVAQKGHEVVIVNAGRNNNFISTIVL